MHKPYDQEFTEQALRMLAEAIPEHTGLHATSKHIGGLHRCTSGSMRVWPRQPQVDSGIKYTD